MQNCDIAETLYEVGSISIGEYILSSGLKSKIYIDLRKVLSFVKARNIIKNALLAELANKINIIDVVVGIATGGIPWATMIADYYGKPLSYVRPERKDHGTGKLLEGVIEGKNVLLVDDVATTGLSLEKAIKVLNSYNIMPSNVTAIVIVDRGQGASERLRRLGSRLISIISLKDILYCLKTKGFLSDDKYYEIISSISS
ncbi:MAG: orotate phosphoribosyltransferase [Pyrodictiaceae archaeon]